MAEGRIEQSDVTAKDIYGLATESLKKYVTEVELSNKELSNQADLLERITKAANAQSKKGIDQLTTANRSLTKIVSQANANDKERMQILQSETRLRAKLDATIKGERDQIIKLQEENRRATKAKRDSVKATKDEILANDKNAGTLERLEAHNRVLREERKKLNLETAKGKRRNDEINKTIDRNNKLIEKNSDKLKQQRIGIGRYQKALGGLRSALGAIGVTFGLSQLFRGVGGTIIEFDDAVANLGATSGKSADELKPLVAQSKELGATTQFTATEISNLQLELAKLGFTTDEILASTGAISNFAAATGADLPSAAKLGGSALRAFGLEANEMERVVSTLGVATTKTALDFSFLETGLSTVAPVAKTFGFSIEDTTALLGQLANSGFDASSSATATRNILLNLADANGALAQKLKETTLSTGEIAEGFNITNEEAEKLKKSLGNPVKTAEDLALRLKVLKLEGVDLADTLALTDKRSVAAFNTFLDGSDSIGELTESITDQNEALQEMAEKRLDSVSGQWALLTSAVQGYILGADDANGISDKLKNTIGFLAENIATIFDWMGRLIKVFITYKTVMFALKMKDRISEWISFRKEVKKGASSMNDASKSTKGFGQALKGIGFTAAITLTIELAKALYDVASGARQARYDAEQLERQLGVVNKVVDEDIELRQKELQQKLELAKTDKERLELQGQFNKTNRIKASALEKELDKERRKLKLYEGQKKILDDLNESTGGYARTLLESADQAADLFTNYEDIDDQYAKQLAKVKALESGVKKYNTTIEDTSHEVRVMTKATIEDTEAKDENTKATKEQEKAYKDLTDAINAAGEAERERFELIEEFNISESEKGTQSAIDAAKKAAEETGKIEKERIDNAIEREEELKKARIERIFLERVEEAENAEQVALAMEQRNQEIQALDEELYNKRKETLDELEAAQEQYSNNLVEIEKERVQREIEAAAAAAEEEERIRKELFDALEEIGDQEIDNMIERSKKKQDILNQEKDAIEKNMDLLRNAANSQNAIASQSLAALEQQQAEKVRQLEEEAEKEAALEELKAAWSALNSFIDQGDNFASATAKALTGVATFKQTLASVIPFFAKGTKDAPEGLAVTDEQGAEMHLDKYGNIKDFGSDDGARVKYLERGDKILTASETKARQTEMINRQLSGAAIMQSIAMNSKKQGDETLILEMRQLRKTIESKPEYSLHPLIKDGLLVGLKETKKTGSKIEHFRTLKRS